MLHGFRWKLEDKISGPGQGAQARHLLHGIAQAGFPADRAHAAGEIEPRAQGAARGSYIRLGKLEAELERAQLGIGFEGAADLGGDIKARHAGRGRIGGGEERKVYVGRHAEQSL